MRDLLRGVPSRDLDFTVEKDAIKTGRALASALAGEVVTEDPLKRWVEILLPGALTVSIGNARTEKHSKPGGKPQIAAATIHEDLARRDFTVNAIALSLGKASRGLLLDPTNGLGELSRKELRAVSNYALYDDPSRILRMIRLKTRFGFTIDERTMSQYQNVREAKLETKIAPPAVKHELLQMAADPLAGDILKALEDEKLISLISPTLSGAKLNLAGFQKLQKARQSLPFGMTIPTDSTALFLFILLEKLSPKERVQLAKSVELTKEELDAAHKLELRANKLDKELASAKITRPSALFAMLSKVPGEVLLFILMRSNHRLVLDRVKNYLQKYLPMSQEVSAKDVVGAEPGTPKFQKLFQQMINAKLDARPKKIVVEEVPPPPPPMAGRRSASFAR